MIITTLKEELYAVLEIEAVAQRFSVKKVFLEAACNFIKKETLAPVFSCEFCEVSRNTFSNRTPPVAVFLEK